MEDDALAFHLLHAAVDVVLLHLEVGDAVAQQAAGLGLTLIDMHIMPGTGELLGGGKAGRAGAHHCHALAGAHLRGLGLHPAHLPRLVGDGLLDGLDGDRHVFEIQRAGFLARGGADAAGEFREIVGGVQVARRLLPVVLVDEVVPVGDLVVDRAAGGAMAEGNAAIHAARGLVGHLAVRQGQGELTEMPNAVGSGLILLLPPVDLKKPGDLSHTHSSGARRTAAPPAPLQELFQLGDSGFEPPA